VQPSSRKHRPDAIENASTSKVAKQAAATATEAARHCARSRDVASDAVRRALHAVSHPVTKSASSATAPTIPVSMSVVTYWSSTKK